LCQKELAEWVDKGCPQVLGGPLPHAMAAKAVALAEASQPAFRDYAARIVANAQALGESLMRRGANVVTGGTDNHLLLVDVAKGTAINGRQAESALRECRLTLNRNALPFDPNGPWYTSGLRLGTPAMTTLGMGPAEMDEIATIITDVLAKVTPATIQKGPKQGQPSPARFELPAATAESARERVGNLLRRFPLYPELDLDLLLSAQNGGKKPT
jgi:glycine hydroxymethyltransferase